MTNNGIGSLLTQVFSRQLPEGFLVTTIALLLSALVFRA
ncbi:MAG: hypothetical protein ACI845_001455, partial [Gammaproteobacteria bacterium]